MDVGDLSDRIASISINRKPGSAALVAIRAIVRVAIPFFLILLAHLKLVWKNRVRIAARIKSYGDSKWIEKKFFVFGMNGNHSPP